MTQVPVALTVAGSDSGAGAGIQADLKTFAAFQVYGVSALTAVTAQNTLGISAIQPLDPTLVAAQIDAVAADPGVDAVKVGMLANAGIVEAVADRLRRHGLTKVVVDPVIAAKDASRLLDDDALDAMRRLLLPLALVATPNAYEAEALAGHKVATMAEAYSAAQAIAALGPKCVVITGGHLGVDATDLVYDGAAYTELPAPRLSTKSTHGAGCTYSSAITAGLALGLPAVEAVRRGKEYVRRALEAAFPLGAGHGPLHHFHHWWAGAHEPHRGA